MARFQTCIHDKARATSYYMAEDKESVFIGTLFYFAQIKHMVFVQFSQIEKKYAKKVLQLRSHRSIMTVQVKERSYKVAKVRGNEKLQIHLF